MGGSAQLFDEDGDATVAEPTEPPQPPSVQGSLPSDWVDAWGFTPQATVTLAIYDSEGGTLLFGPEARPTDGDGHYFLEGGEHGVDLTPGMFVTVTDDTTGVVKDLTLENLTLDSIDFDNDIVSGTAPDAADGRSVNVGFGNESGGCGFDVAVTAGLWSANFADCEGGFDITEDMGGSAQLFDEDGDATVTEPTPEEGINGAHVNVHNSVVGSETQGYGFEVFIGTFGFFGDTDVTDVKLWVDGDILVLQPWIELNSTSGDRWDIHVGGEYLGEPTLGAYRVEVTDGYGVTWAFDIGRLEDIPQDAPHMVFPTHLALTTDNMPTFSWEEFTSDYLGTPVEPWAYEVNLSASSNEEEGSWVFPIDPGITSIAYDHDGWQGEPLPLDGLEPGVYSATVHSNHDVAPGFNFEHHRNLVFVVYDPTGGFATGGGWIDSPEGAFDGDPELTGRVTFGFVSKYKEGAAVPTGSTEFQFRSADLIFHSNSYEWLAVTGGNATYKGTGTINGSGDYGFMLTACDVKIAGDCQGEDEDTFRIRIWDNSSGDPVYDDGGTPLAGGNIRIHESGPS